MPVDRITLGNIIDAADAAVDNLVTQETAFLVFSNADKGGLISCGVVSGARGSIVSIPINWKARGSHVSLLQFDMNLPLGTTFQSATAGPALTAEGKLVQANVLGQSVRVIALSFTNNNEVKDGHLLTISLNVGQTTFQAFHPLSLSNLTFSSPGAVSEKAFAISGGLIVL